MSVAFGKLTVKVVIKGNDVSSAFAPRLLEVTVSKKAKRAAHTCEIELADVDGLLLLPKDGDDIVVGIGRNGPAQTIFTGVVNNVSSSGGTGGRKLKVSGTSADQKGKVKQQALRHKDKSKFSAVAKEWGQKAGLEVSVIGELAEIERDYWSMQNESFQQWGMRTAAELGATFQVVGKRAAFAPRNEGKSASGKDLTPITAAWGDNLLEWDIASADSRTQYKKVKARYRDPKTNEWKQVDAEVKDADSEAELTLRLSETSEGSAKARVKAAAKESKRSKGGGSATIVGNAAAEPEAKCTLVGTRPGIDGEYRIDDIEHKASESGWKTKLTLKLPEGAAGKDGRKSSGAGGGATSSEPRAQGRFAPGG